jgi:2,4-didehydro-3-deoxy-L-rhamnonate hydrolase
MKLMRVGTLGKEIPCIQDENGQVRDVSSLVPDFSATTIEGLITSLGNAKTADLPRVDVENKRRSSPMAQPRNIYCIGLNYSDHAAEAGLPIPDEPILFNKSASAFCGPNDPIFYSAKMSKLDWEVELGIVIGRTALNISKDEALDHILGFTLVNDVSERAWQLDRSGQWSKGKSFPNFCPTGPFIVTPDELDLTSGLPMWLDVNGQRMQDGNTNTMIFDCVTIVSYLSEFIRLEPGDLICTGTPPGVGMGKTPQVWLNVGDTVRLGIDGLGEQEQTVTRL